MFCRLPTTCSRSSCCLSLSAGELRALLSSLRVSVWGLLPDAEPYALGETGHGQRIITGFIEAGKANTFLGRHEGVESGRWGGGFYLASFIRSYPMAPRDENRQAFYDYAGQLMRQGQSNKQVQLQLQARGLPAQLAAIFTQQMRSQFRDGSPPRRYK